MNPIRKIERALEEMSFFAMGRRHHRLQGSHTEPRPPMVTSWLSTRSKYTRAYDATIPLRSANQGEQWYGKAVSSRLNSQTPRNDPLSNMKSTRISKGEIIADLRVLARALNHSPSSVEYKRLGSYDLRT